jgi:hypothetical protein
MQYLKLLIASLIAASVLNACSNSDSVTSEPQLAILSTTNVQELSLASTNAANQSKSANNLRIFKSGNPNSQTALSEIIAKNLPPIHSATTNINLCSSGSMVMTNDGGASSTLVFNECVLIGTVDPVLMHGTATVSSTNDGSSIAFNYIDFSVTYNGITTVIDAGVSCNGVNTTNVSCSMDISFTGTNGRHYIVADLTVSGSPDTGITISASVTDPVHGLISVASSTPVSFNCDSPNENYPSSGSITFTGANNATASIVYDDCTRYTVTFNGVPTTYYW